MFLRVCICAVGLYAVALGALDYTMHLTPERFSRTMKYLGASLPFILFPFETMWKEARAGHLRTGDLAPDFTLPVLDSSERVTLSSFRGKQPVVLVFGSYT
jgi:hypothetical protein